MKIRILLQNAILAVLLLTVSAFKLNANIPPELSCAIRCRDNLEVAEDLCHCDPACVQYNDCCLDYNSTVCFGKLMPCKRNCDELQSSLDTNRNLHAPATDQELLDLSYSLIQLDKDNVNNVANKVVIQAIHPISATPSSSNYLTVPAAELSKDTIKMLIGLYELFHADITTAENFNSADQKKILGFITAIFSTDIMKKVLECLTKWGIEFSPAVFKQIWFDQYSRNGPTGVKGSSGFEQVFLGELTPTGSTYTLSGLHNWIYFHAEQSATPTRIQYLGTRQSVYLNIGGWSISENSFNWKKLGTAWVKTPMTPMFIGTSPELEIALYTVCFLTRPNGDCPLNFHGLKFKIQTKEIIQANVKYVDHAYPVLQFQ